jgi:hypothetical protein
MTTSEPTRGGSRQRRLPKIYYLSGDDSFDLALVPDDELEEAILAILDRRQQGRR